MDGSGVHWDGDRLLTRSTTIVTRLYGEVLLCVDMLDVSGYHLFIRIKVCCQVENFAS